MGLRGLRRLALLGLVVLAVLAPRPLAADEYDALFQQLLVTPDDPELNLRYAGLAEARGEPRHALAAYERALAGAPGDLRVRRAYRRLKRRMLPAVTAVTVATGLSYASNPRQLPSAERRKDDVTWDAALYLFDERTLARHRWRTEGFARTQVQGRVKDLDEGDVAFWTGPVFELAPDRRLHVAAGAGIAFLDGRRLYNDAMARLTYEWLRNGVDQAVKARIAYRDTDSAFRGSNGLIVDLTGHFTLLPELIRGDALYVLPRLRYSGPTGDGPLRVFSRPLFPGDFVEAGNRLAYYVPVRAGKAYLGGGFALYYRDYAQNVAFRTDKREDWFLEPTAHLVLPHLFGSGFDFRVDYRYEKNDSNDRTEDFENHVAGVRAVRRF